MISLNIGKLMTTPYDTRIKKRALTLGTRMSSWSEWELRNALRIMIIKGVDLWLMSLEKVSIS